MNADIGGNFCWDDLLHYIHMNNVIPVIGEGLYWVRHKDENSTEPFLLYPYLAQTFVKEMGLQPLESNETFSQALFRYQEKNPHSDINISIQDFLIKHLDLLIPVPHHTLWQLARIKPFGLFINTTYDNYLPQILRQVRSHPVKSIHYTLNKKWSIPPDASLFQQLEARECSVIFNIYGNAYKSIAPAYTEKDILETIVAFQKDMEIDRHNVFFQKLERSNLLFIGCKYDDWLFRFFIRTMSNKPYTSQKGTSFRQFVGDDFPSFCCGDLQRFLKAHGTEVFYSKNNVELVAQLFPKIQDKYPHEISQPLEYPAHAFISFHDSDRAVAQRLTQQLREDGIDVWLDQKDLPPADRVDEVISRAISACPIFIPLVSENARQLQPEAGNAVRYHVREWEWGYGQYSKKQNPKHIFPLVIDDTQWMYDSFKPIAYLKIPRGERNPDYEKLRKRLIELLEQSQR